MFWSNITEKGPERALKVYYAFKSAWKYSFLIILCSFKRLKIKVSDILNFWESRFNRVISKIVL